MKNDPLDGINVFLALAEHLNFSRAAEQLGMSRATVSAQIGELEQRLGVRLFQRSTRNVTLTEAGLAYQESLDGILSRVREAERAAGVFQTEAVGRLRITASNDFSPHLLPVIARFLRNNPSLTIDLDLSFDTVNVVEQGFDLAIRATVSVEENLITRAIGDSPIRICASPDYLAEAGTPATPDDLAGHSLLHFSRLRWGHAWMVNQGGESQRVPIVPRLEVNDGTALREAAVASGGITFLPDFIVGDAIRKGKLVPLLPDWSAGAIPLHAVYPANRHITLKVRNFVTYLIAQLRKSPDIVPPG